MAILYQDQRRNLGRNQTRTYGPVTMPAGGYVTLRVSIDLIESQRQDPTRRCKTDVEVSTDGGASYVYWMGAETWGSPLRDPSAQAWVQTAAPPAGALVRATFTAGPDSPVAVGIIVEGDPAP